MGDKNNLLSFINYLSAITIVMKFHIILKYQE